MQQPVINSADNSIDRMTNLTESWQAGIVYNNLSHHIILNSKEKQILIFKCEQFDNAVLVVHFSCELCFL